MAVYTFVCLTRSDVSGMVDIQDLPGGSYRQHAMSLLREHASAAAVEVWRDDDLLETIDRTVAGSRSAGGEPRSREVPTFNVRSGCDRPL
jgi:hypothetical protein